MVKLQKRRVLKISVLFTLLILFYIYYFKQVFKHFSEELTNTAKYDEKITAIEPPTITVCFTPSFKPSVFEKYNITDWIFFGDYFPDVTAKKTIKAQLIILQKNSRIVEKLSKTNHQINCHTNDFVDKHLFY